MPSLRSLSPYGTCAEDESRPKDASTPFVPPQRLPLLSPLSLLSLTQCSCLTPPTLVYFLTFISTLGGFLFGYDTGIISGATFMLEQPPMSLRLSEIETVVSSTILGAILGALFAGFSTIAYGRKNSIVLSSLVFILASVLMGLAPGYVLLVLGRFLVGLAIGLSSMAVPLYIAEVAPPDSRGVLMTLNTVCCTGGQVVAACIAGVLFHVPHGWRYMLGLGAFPAIIQLFGMVTLPESPRWLMLKGKVMQAKEVLCKIRLEENVEKEYSAMQHIVLQDGLAPITKSLFSVNQWKEIVRTPSAVKALSLGCALQALQQFSGINSVMYYGATLIRYAGFTQPSHAIWLAALVASSNFWFTFVGIYCIDRHGRRKLTLWSFGIVVFFLFLLSFAFYLRESQGSHSIPSFWVNWFIIFCLFSYLGAYASGMGSTPWLINTEIYPAHLRGTGVGVATCVNWTCNLLISCCFLSMVERFSSYGTFLIFAAIDFIGWIYLYRNLPETAGKSLEEIQALLEKDE